MTRRAHGNIHEILGRGSVHPFPARMAPDLAFDLISESERSLRVLDPMSGSGTVLAFAQAKGHHAFGYDLDPLAVLMSRVWTTEIDVLMLQKIGEDTLEKARSIFSFLQVRDAYPEGADEETRKFIRYWFDDYARRQLTSLSMVIREIQDVTIRNALWCAFSRLIITKKSGASLAMDLSHSRPHKKFSRAPVKPFNKFLLAVNRIAANCIMKDSNSTVLETRVVEGDARFLRLPDGFVDLVVTSPPYLNAIDYMRCSKYSLVWMGYVIAQLRQIRSTSIGAEVKLMADRAQDARKILTDVKFKSTLASRHEDILIRYIDDMRRMISETSRVLKNEGRAVYVVGENTVRGTFIPNAKFIKLIAAEIGLRCISCHSRKLSDNRRYLPPPSVQSGNIKLNSRMRREVVLSFKKSA